jgi:hypothetical protein
VIRQGSCDGPEKPCHKPTYEDKSISLAIGPADDLRIEGPIEDPFHVGRMANGKTFILTLHNRVEA